MKCPNCRKPATLAHFREHPECGPAVASLCATYRASKRVTPPKGSSGRPPLCIHCSKPEREHPVYEMVAGVAHTAQPWCPDIERRNAATFFFTRRPKKPSAALKTAPADASD